MIKDENGLPRVRDINESLITLSLRRACLHFHACFCCMKRLEIPPPPFRAWVASPSNSCFIILRFNDRPLAAPCTVYALRWRRGSVCVKCIARQQHNTIISKYMALKLSPLIFTALAEVILSMIYVGKIFKVSPASKKVGM